MHSWRQTAGHIFEEAGQAAGNCNCAKMSGTDLQLHPSFKGKSAGNSCVATDRPNHLDDGNLPGIESRAQLQYGRLALYCRSCLTHLGPGTCKPALRLPPAYGSLRSSLS